MLSVLLTGQKKKKKKKKKKIIFSIITDREVPDLDFWGPYAKLCRGGGGGGGGGMDETHLSVFHSVSNRARGKRSRNSISSAARITSRFFFLSKSKRLDDIHIT